MSIDKFRGRFQLARGSFLIELMVAIAILTTMAFVIFQFQWNIRRLHIDSYRRLRAMDHASGLIEAVLQAKKLPNQTEIQKEGYRLEITAQKAELKGNEGLAGI